MRLEVTADDGTSWRALNEVVVEKIDSGRTVRVSLDLNDDFFLDNLHVPNNGVFLNDLFFLNDSFLNGEDFQFVYDGLSYNLIIDNILPVLDKTYRTHTARLKFTENPAPTGSHGELKWKDEQLAVPSNMVVVRNKQAGVLVANSNKAQFVAVDSYTEGHPAFVTLDPDTQIITIGRHGLKSGDAITISP